ncbi:MAG: hypothetical protein AB7O59_18710 [Pirellulales bacterium]
MLRRLRSALVCAAICCCTSGMMSGAASAGTILKLGLGGDAPSDIEFDGLLLSTIDDGDGTTAGDQNTNVDFQDFLIFIPDILTPIASFTLDGLTVSGPPTVFGGVLVFQDFAGGMLELYDPGNTLLLSASLSTSVLTA